MNRDRCDACDGWVCRRHRVHGVAVTDEALYVELADGRALSVPLNWFPRLIAASDSERADYRLIGDGTLIHWPAIDEDIDVANLDESTLPVTLNEAAALLGLSPLTLRSQIRNGTLRATKKGRDWHVTPAEVERYRAASLGQRGRPRKEQA